MMAVLGHRDPRVTIRYQHLSPGHLRRRPARSIVARRRREWHYFGTREGGVS
jgi:hypothetical protein